MGINKPSFHKTQYNDGNWAYDIAGVVPGVCFPYYIIRRM